MTRFFVIPVTFAFLTLAVAFPAVKHFHAQIPRGTEPADTVPLLNAWTLWWNLDRVEAGLADYWNAPIFYPAQGTFAFSEPQPILMLLAPLDRWLDLAALYNLYLLLSLFFNGLAGYALFRGLKFSPSAAFCGGVLIETLPFTHSQLGVLQLIPLWGALCVILSLVKLNESRSFRWSALLGAALAMTYWCCNYYGVFLVVLLAPAGLILVSDRLREGRFWGQVAAAALLFSVLAGPLVWGQLKHLGHTGLRRDAQEVADLSAVPEDYVRFPFVNVLNPIHRKPTNEPQRCALSSGLCSYVLALAGLLSYLFGSSYKKWGLFSVVLCVEAYLLSMGPGLDDLGVPLYRILSTIVPGYSRIRSLLRFGLFVQLACVFLGTLFLQTALERIPNIGSSRWRAVLTVAAVLLLGITLVERWPPPSPVGRVPWLGPEPAWCRYIREETPADAALACFPFPADIYELDYEPQTHWMLASAWHHRPLVNGYSGFLPDSYFRIRAAALKGPDQECLDLLLENGVHYCVLQRTWITESPLDLQDFQDNPHLQHLFSDPAAGIEIYKVVSNGSDQK